MRGSGEQPEVFANMSQATDLQGDDLVGHYQLETCIGKTLLVDGRVSGAFCVAFSAPHDVLPHEIALFSMLAKAIEIEEERRNLQEALIRSEDKYRSLVEGNLYPISIVDSQGAICYCNDVMAAMFRYSQPSSLLGRDFLGLFHPGDRQPLA